MPDLPEERRVVTALFADVVGSTALAERHDPEEARLIVGEAIARAARIVEAYGGSVKDLAGDGMLALFGAPVAHEDDPERALPAALEIAATVAEYAEEVRRGGASRASACASARTPARSWSATSVPAAGSTTAPPATP
jgi:class 3 adenylate cyclase